MRSSWERHYADYLEFLVRAKQIVGWQYEPETFWFEGVRRGVCSYKPDFKVEVKPGEYEYHEVKGYNDARSRTTLIRMDKYYPAVKVVLIDASRLRGIMRRFCVKL
jgi:hypothetical protein